MENQDKDAEQEVESTRGSAQQPLPASGTSNRPAAHALRTKRLDQITNKYLMKELGLAKKDLDVVMTEVGKILKAKELVNTNWHTNKGNEALSKLMNDLEGDRKFRMACKDNTVNEKTWSDVHRNSLGDLIKKVSRNQRNQMKKTSKSPASTKPVEGDTLLQTSKQSMATKVPGHTRSLLNSKDATRKPSPQEENDTESDCPVTTSEQADCNIDTPAREKSLTGEQATDQERTSAAAPAIMSTEHDREATSHTHSEEEDLSEPEPLEYAKVNKPQEPTVPYDNALALNWQPAIKKRRLNSSTSDAAQAEEIEPSNNVGCSSCGLSKITSAGALQGFAPLVIIKSQVDRFSHECLPLNEFKDPDTGEYSLKQLLHRLQSGPLRFDCTRHAISWRSHRNIRIVINTPDQFGTAIERQLFLQREVHLLIETKGCPGYLKGSAFSNTFTDL